MEKFNVDANYDAKEIKKVIIDLSSEIDSLLSFVIDLVHTDIDNSVLMHIRKSLCKMQDFVYMIYFF